MLLTIDGIPVTVTQKKIKHIHLRVKAPDGRVELSAPAGMSEETILSFLREKADWMARQREKFAARTEPGPREYVSGERLPVWGKDYMLEVTEGKRFGLTLTEDRALFTVKENSTREQRERWVNEWYRARLRETVTERLPLWEQRTGLHPDSWQIKNMTTRWGTCNTKDRRIWLSLQLAGHGAECLDYVILHELTHLLERGHNARFYAHMDRHMPDWRERKKKLNGQI